MNTIIKQTVELGKVAYHGRSRSNMAEGTLELRRWGDGVELSIMGAIWNHIHTDCYTCGQCLDTIAEYIGNNPTFKRVYRLWKDYHLKTVTAEVIDEVYDILGIESRAVA